MMPVRLRVGRSPGKVDELGGVGDNDEVCCAERADEGCRTSRRWVILSMRPGWSQSSGAGSVCSYSCRDSYTVQCQFWNWQRCTRYRSKTCYRCCDGWTGGTSNNCPTAICFGREWCPNGGTCRRPDYCSCRRGYYSPRCNRCTAIAHCNDVSCTTSSDQICSYCEGDYGSLGSAYKLSSNKRVCLQQCSWRTDSNACYPGTCSYGTNCRCSTGFSGNDCRTMESSQVPILSKHSATLISGSTTLESPSDQGSMTTVYTSVNNFSNLRINWIISYQPTGLPDLHSGGYPYIHSVRLGVVGARARVTVNRGESLIYTVGNPTCTTATSGVPFSQSSPATNLVSCETTLTLNYNDWTPASGDVLRFDTYSTSGGFMKLYNRDSSNRIETRYYSGTTSSASSTFTFDFDDPYHCVDVGRGCRKAMLNAGNDITSREVIRVQWQGWIDDLAGVKEYDLEVRQLSGSHGNKMTEIFHRPAVYRRTTSSGCNVTLPHLGVYSIVLAVVDHAGNVKRSRRFVFFDNDPNDVTIQSDSPLRVVSATAETNFTWLTNLESGRGTTTVGLDWTGHFINVNHHNQGFLKPIGSYAAGTIHSDYDQYFGQRGRAGIPNKLGITQFRTYSEIDHSGGKTTVSVSDTNSDNWRNEATNTQVTYDLSLVDGDSIRFWVEARDLAGHFLRDNVLVHADSSPPVIEDFWLVRDGEVNLAIHHSANLHEMRFVFRAYDIHSGLRNIEWRLFENHTGTEMEYGHQSVPVRKLDMDSADCYPVDCLCTPIGDCYAADYSFSPTNDLGTHDHDYFIALTVMNQARLVATQMLKITVDTSPPQAGVVHDGIPGSNEVDFQEGNDLTAHWQGFFDKESGIKFYQYLFGDSCWTSPSSVRDVMTRTTSTHASWTAPSPGRYYVTVIAYNRALEPSEAVCSDGVVIDTSPPELSQIVISYARIWPGLAKDNEGRVWFVDEHRKRMELVDASSGCSSKATMVEDLSIYPEMAGTNDSVAILKGDLDCLWILAIQQKIFLPTHKHVIISWAGDDAESSIYDYEIGLSTNPINPTPDLVTFTSTSGHDHFVMYHPHISHGVVFYLALKATNKAQLSTYKVVGPIIVDTTPPMFVGRVSVRVEDEYLVAEWGDDSFIDDEDTDLRYQVAVSLSKLDMGISPGGSETPTFQLEKNYRIGPCSTQSSCAAFSLDDLDWHLHGDHEYYVSVRAQNGAGLATVGTSSVYRPIVQLPSVGVVLDVAPPGEEVAVEFGFAKDIDVQMDTKSISARWFGFEHPHLDISYEIAVGSGGNDLSDASHGFVNVGSATFYRLNGLDLTPLTTYHVTIRANSEAGSVNITSDGVKIMQMGEILEGATIKDGLGCGQDEASVHPGLSHHSSPADQPCQDDITYQASTSDIAARWTIPDMLQPFVTNVLWTVEQEIEAYHEAENTTLEWIPVLGDQDLGMTFQHIGADIGFQSGGHFRSKVQLCHVSVCFQPIVTDGFWVLSQPPEVGQVTVSNIESTQGRTEIHVAFQPFAHDYVLHDNPQELMDFYEWSIAEDGNDGALLSQWTKIENLVITVNVAYFTASYSGLLDLDICHRLSVRGYNKAGLSSIASTEIVDCDEMMTLIVPHVVIDADHKVNLEQNALWPEPDKNYVSSTSSLSAVWPTLRHRAYVWAAIEDTGSTKFGDLDSGLQYPCDHPHVKACGDTDKEFVNVPDLALEHGKRYRICIHADEVTLQHQGWNERLSAVSNCSDGVVIDTTPPTPGSVWVGRSQHQHYQSSTSELVLHWESFIDIEEHGMARHHTGIRYYEYAIGSMRGGSDVKEFTRVGITNSAIVHGIRLQNGHTYYATVRATDFVGLSSQVVADPVTIDASPPVVNGEHTLDVGGSFIRSTTSMSASWKDIFSDKESSVAYFEWAVGSHPGHADIMPFTRESTETGISDPSRPLALQEGHSYFVSVKAINTVGLITLKSYGAFTVDASPPLAGHVFDGNPAHAPANHKDRDFQDDRTMLWAFWEGFHDPHSSIFEYSWRAGLCPGCTDVVPEQHVGLETDVHAGNLNLVPGLTYYLTVTACNAAGLCTSVTSDGVMVDDTPPVPGRVYDGSAGGGDVSYQSSRLRLQAHWWGFHDPHSGLSHYEWRAGTTPGAADIFPSTRIELSEGALIFLPVSDQLPVDTDIYITVRAYNRVSAWSEATSNGFRVDSSPPDVVDPPAAKSKGVAVQNTQVLRDVIHISWKFRDPESGIKDQYISVSTHHNGDVGIHPMKIAGSEIDHTFTNLTLHEGSRYIATVVACNLASLCTESKAEPVLVDFSPPSVGTFAVGTESAANLERHHIDWIDPTEPNQTNTASPHHHHHGWMSWLEDNSTSNGSLALAWLGFADVHSGISHYFVSVGRTYGGSQLTPHGPARINHSDDGMPLDEGIVQTAIVPLEGSIADISPPYLYVSIWAVNGVGLPSSRHHSAFEISAISSNEGTLVLLRHCSPSSCEGHCACAPIDRACNPDQSCTDVSNNNPNTEIEVLDVLDLMYEDIEAVTDIDYTPTQHTAAAVWRITDRKGLDIKWCEWSIGDDSSSEPVGVFDPVNERVWFDVGQDDNAIIVLDEEHKLLQGVTYHIFVRAWYDANIYAVFKSDGIVPDVTPPKVSTIRSMKVKDLPAADARTDTDYLTSVSFISWEGMFSDHAMSHYLVSLSTHPGGEDIRQFADHSFPADATSTEFTSLDLQSGVRYFSNVRAFNKAGLHTLRSSDGFVVDTRRPDPGLVFDGIDLHDVEYQNSSTVISASWHGFVDLESYIDHYEWCVGQTPSPTDASILPCTDVGIHLSASKTLAAPLTDGIRYYSKISAFDAAGQQSMSVSSNGFVVDTTPPEPAEHILVGDNLIQNPSFEEKEELHYSDMDYDRTVSSGDGLSGGASGDVGIQSLSSPESGDFKTWDIKSGSQFSVVSSEKKIAKDGHSFLSLRGAISQTFNTTMGSQYQIVIFVSHMPSQNPLLNQEVCIEAPGLNHVFRLYDRPAHGHSDESMRSIQWHRQRFYFTASEDVSTLKISSVGRSNGILLDNVQLRQISIRPTNDDGSVQVFTQFIYGWSSLQAKWHFIDPESPIVDYSWAIGTTRGGIQLQGFTSVGTRTDAINTDLRMAHGSRVYVTVMARNAADLIAISTSAPEMIDLTPPEILSVIDGKTEQDVDFSADDSSLSFRWSASDAESEIDHCEWAVGSEPKLDDIIPWSQSPNATSTITTSLSQIMVEGQSMYATVICYNHNGQSSWKSSDGVTIVTESPSALAAVVSVKTLPETQYTSQGYQSQRDSLKASWDGFIDPIGIQSYQCFLSGPNISTSWRPCGSTSETHLDWSGLSLLDDATYSLSVRAISHAGLISEAVSVNFTVESTKPTGGAPSLIRSSWLGNGTVEFAWDGLFSSSSSLVYEVSLGTIPGSSDIMQWVETMDTGMRVSPLVPYTNYHLTLTAINAAGLSHTVRKVISV
ncbi:uncharacterized protein LOC110984469 isoform X2 [Acanthaster planci]|uniref:Uncharacterized protein LOC110984469 isoform X2 n=1 Tax=Acanthaster planci TaxID=133434 RepID=A0A8B7Z6G3_ACAPL|nr:uncharacterized protein LOC110984469 isoform X2 [Acanthaster planci]